MRRLRAWLLLGFAGLGGLALFVSRSDANPETVRIIAPGVWFREGDMDQGHCNNIIIEMKDYLIVVDANFPSGARGAMADAKRISTKPVKYVFDTHHHGDHLYGNAIWTQAGATTLAFKGVAEELKRLEPARWQDAAKTRKDVAELKRDAPEPPKQDINETTVRAERRLAQGGVPPLRLGAHQRRRLRLPAEGAGALHGRRGGERPIQRHHGRQHRQLAHGAPRAGKLKVKYVLPGHGLPGGRELIAGQAQFMTELHKAVKAGADQGKKVEELQASVSLPESVSTLGQRNGLKRQIKDAYDEISKTK